MPRGRRARKSVSNGATGRDSAGRFAAGNKLGTGNPNLRRLAEYRHAINNAVTPATLRAVLKKLITLAKEGDMAAIKELLDRTIGKAKPAPEETEFAGIDLPVLATSSDAVDASNAILRAMSEGRIGPDDASKMAAIVELARRTIETHELAERIAALEKETAHG